jgi:hypothetical protein
MTISLEIEPRVKGVFKKDKEGHQSHKQLRKP